MKLVASTDPILRKELGDCLVSAKITTMKKIVLLLLLCSLSLFAQKTTIKGKLLDAMRCATPSITTWIGAEGIISNDQVLDTDESADARPWPGALCSTRISELNAVQDYVDKAIALYNDENNWNLASEMSKSVLSSFENNQPDVPFIERMCDLQQTLDKHRSSLFMQSLLWHQTLTASKYMSQWIEAKNK